MTNPANPAAAATPAHPIRTYAPTDLDALLAHPAIAAMRDDPAYLASHGIHNHRPAASAPTCSSCAPAPAPAADLPTLDDAITTAGQALDAAERRLSALTALQHAIAALDAMADAPELPAATRDAVAALPTTPLRAHTAAQLHTATAEVRRLELAVAAAQQAFRAARPVPAPKAPTFRAASDVETFIRTERLAIGLTPRKLTAIQLAGLRLIIRKPASVWDLGSTTVNVLRSAGYIETADGWATATPAGIKASAEDPR